MPRERQAFGKKSEAAAMEFLRRPGYSIIECNYRNTLGEIDIIARDRDVIVFVEVKAKKRKGSIHPKYSITLKKQKKLSAVALCYLKAKRHTRSSARFDVVTVLPAQDNPEIERIRNAFELAYP